MEAMDDMTLLREYAARHSETAFETLVSRRAGFVYSAALRQVRDPHLAAEVTQVVFIILAQKAARIPEKTILTGWLFKTTRFAALAQTRTAAKRREREQEAQLQTEIQHAAPDPLWEQMSPMLDEALASLGEADRQAILLRFFENKGLAEVGNALKSSEDTARKRVTRALEKMRKYFSRRGVVSTAAIIATGISANSVQAAPIALAKSVTAAAIAKGAAASGSTLTLAKGALKLMAWRKTQTTIVIAAATGMLAVGSITWIAHRPPGMTFTGTLTDVYPLAPSGPQTNIYKVTLRSQSPNWELSLNSSNSNYKAFASRKQTFETYIFGAPPGSRLNTAQIEIFPGPRVIGNPVATHVWLALLSGSSFIGRRVPLPDPGLGGIAEPCLITQVNGGRDNVSPREMQWINEFPGGRTVRFEGEFKWLASTNLGPLKIPILSQMTSYLVDETGNRKISHFSELNITGVGPLDVPPKTFPHVPGRNLVFDYRLSDLLSFKGRRPPLRYDVQDGEGLEKMPSVRHR